MKILIQVLIAIDLFVLVLSASLADSETIIPLIVCAIATFFLVPLAIVWKDFED